MKAGRELDALIATKVMGWDRPITSNFPWQLHKPDTDEFAVTLCHHYSTDISAAWEVVEKLRASKYELLICTFRGGWSVDILDNGKVMEVANAETAPLAICLAALKAMQS